MSMEPYSFEELMEVTVKLMERYTAGDSTSVSYERAEQLMGAVVYCIREYEQRQVSAQGNPAFDSEDRALVCAGKQLSAAEAYEQGYQIVLKKARRVRDIYHRMLPFAGQYQDKYLEHIMTREIPQFLRKYDPRFCPQDTILILDYPVKKDLSGLCGVDAVLVYVTCIVQELAAAGGAEQDGRK